MSLAHLICRDGRRIEQTLKEHCVQTAKYAADSLKMAGLYNTGYLAGLLHDMGKAKAEFSAYLEAAAQGEEVIKGSVNHTFAGSVYLLEKFHNESSNAWEKMTSEILAFAIGSHHGMFDCVDLDGNNGFIHRLKKNRKEIGYEESLHNFFEQVTTESDVEIYFYEAKEEVQRIFTTARKTYGKSNEQIFFQLSMLCRLVLSAVIYGDRRDTAEFMGQLSTTVEQCQEVIFETDWTKQWEYFEQKISEFDQSSALNQVRREISDQCFRFAQRPGGIYRLNVPTGGGKTISAYRYMLAYAKKYCKKRIIFIIPLLSVLEQNAKVIREYTIDQDMVLEHHSNIVRESTQRDELDPYEMAMENWDAPIVISTLVQLLNVLFANQTSAVSRMRALCDSVIVIDEIQSLPKKVTEMFNAAMNFLSLFCNTTIVLSSATQPCFEETKWPILFAEKPDMVRLHEEQLSVFKRSEIVDCIDRYGMDFDESVSFLSDLMELHQSLLVICNTKEEARQLFIRLKECGGNGWDIYHLSTAMCQKHRMNVLGEIQDKLTVLQRCIKEKKQVKKLICISTQLVEAGVDFSFEAVVRVLAGIDNLAQAAGRCNRSYEYENMGRVYLIKLKNENLSMLKDIVNAQNAAMKVLANKSQLGEESLIGETATRMYYQYLFETAKDELEYPVNDYGIRLCLAKLLGNSNQNADGIENSSYVLHQPFATVGKLFKVFDDNTTDVLVPFEQGKQVIEELRKMENYPWEIHEMRNAMQRAKLYSVSLHEGQRDKLDHAGMLNYLCDGRILVLDEQAYDEECGVTIIEEQAVENFIM